MESSFSRMVLKLFIGKKKTWPIIQLPIQLKSKESGDLNLHRLQETAQNLFSIFIGILMIPVAFGNISRLSDSIIIVEFLQYTFVKSKDRKYPPKTHISNSSFF